MTVRGRYFGLLVLLVFSAFALGAQPQPLNPTVTLLPEATAPVPPECDDSATPPPRLEVERLPPPPIDVPPPMPEPPPSTDLRAQLRALHAAVAARDRATFDATLAQTKQMLATYPRGGERSAAMEAVAVFDEIARLWDYQFRSPTGAFFGEGAEGGALLRTLKKYPGYEEAVRREVIADVSGNRFYPTSESMDFLLNVAGERIGRVGVGVEQRAIMPRTPAQPETRVATQPQPQPQPRTRVAETPTRTTPPPSSTSRTPGRRSSEAPAVSPAKPRPGTSAPAASTPSRQQDRRATRRSTRPSTQRSTQPSTEPATTEPSIQPDIDLPAPAGVVSDPADPAAESFVDPATATGISATDTAATGTTVAAPDQTLTTTAVEQAPVVKPDQAATPTPGRRSIVLPLILILIGVGVLILLFRASS